MTSRDFIEDIDIWLDLAVWWESLGETENAKRCLANAIKWEIRMLEAQKIEEMEVEIHEMSTLRDLYRS
jgi:hypothetical protein